MTIRFLTAASVLALVSACSSQPGPSSVSATDQGYSAFRAGDFAAAEQAYAAALSANPASEVAMLGLAEVYEQTGRGHEAANLYAQVHAARSGSIRVWNDGRAMQDGVTETAGRRLGALGHGMGGHTVVSHSTITEFEAPAYVQPMAYAAPSVPAVTEYLPENPTYALDEDGIVYYADPEATQPISEPVFEAPQMMEYAPAMPEPMMAAPTHSGIVYQDAPMVTPVEVVVPAPAAPVTYQPQPMTYEAAPAAMTYEAAPAAMSYEAAPMSYEAAPAAMSYETAPMSFEPAPISFQPAPMAKPVAAPAVAPMPVATRSAGPAVPANLGARSQPGYAVVNGDLVYISAEDIANGSAARTTQGPVGGEVMNGIKIPNLN